MGNDTWAINNFKLFCWCCCDSIVREWDTWVSSDLSLEEAGREAGSSPLVTGLDRALGGLRNRLCSWEWVAVPWQERKGSCHPALQTNKERALGTQCSPSWMVAGKSQSCLPLSCWEQLSLSVGLLSPVKQAHNSHWRWWDYMPLSGEKHSPSLNKRWGSSGSPLVTYLHMAIQLIGWLSAEHSKASFKRTIQPWAFVAWMLLDNFSGSRLMTSNSVQMKRPQDAYDIKSRIKMAADNGFPSGCVFAVAFSLFASISHRRMWKTFGLLSLLLKYPQSFLPLCAFTLCA